MLPKTGRAAWGLGGALIGADVGMKLFPSFFRSRRGGAEAEGEFIPRGPADTRCYAIGDVHGCLDQLVSLIRAIARDNDARRPVRNVHLVMMGDLIDRGPDSRGVIDVLRARPLPGFRYNFIAGNHEELLLRIIDGEDRLVPDWLEFGGMECARSYGVEPARLFNQPADIQAGLIRQAVPSSHVAFLRECADSVRFGDYLFVHAGIRPRVPIEAQVAQDLRWIREGFLDSDVNHGVVVIHGHTISVDPDERGNRIGIDTGAYRTGRLTAIGIDGSERWFLHANGEPAYGYA